jgi:hypothetical protein
MFETGSDKMRTIGTMAERDTSYGSYLFEAVLKQRFFPELLTLRTAI